MFQIALDNQNIESLKGTLRITCTNVDGLDQDVEFTYQKDNLCISVPLTIAEPKKWWPNGLGEAFLYRFKIEVIDADLVLASKELSIGLRTIEVINQADEFGECFYIKVNGQPTFMKGANYIPSDSFLNQVSDEKYKQIFNDAVAANMNMLRVWGGGVYESDRFYQLADEQGILIWQDFIFACSLYPADNNFVANVSQEVEYNIKRLRNHACLALWCGNNETEMGMEFWHWPKTFNYSDELYQKLKSDYALLFKNVLPELVKAFDPSRFYFSSSPIGYWENKADDNRGNNHYWGVWHGEEPFSEFKNRVPRFMSEYGFQSFPLLDSVKKYTIAEDLHINSEVMKSHQKHPRGNALIKQYMADEYREPKDFENFLYLSQVQQALGMKIAFEAHRSAMPFCMGTLYWQFNDCWPVASWSGIDYYGQWKALHYQAKRSFKPLSVFIDAFDETNLTALKVNLVSDHLTAKNLRLSERLMTLDGEVLFSNVQQITAEPNAVSSIAAGDVSTLIKAHDLSQLVFVAQIFADEVDPDNNEEVKNPISEALHYFVPSKALTLKIPQLAVSSTVTNKELLVSIKSNTLARQIHLSLQEFHGNFSDNFFDLLPNVEKNISLAITDKNAAEVTLLSAQLRIISMVDSY